ncbi:MAG: Lrp/AsnC ligand binding domain-containing protein [Candidatus Methylomirabilales bacterium]
MATQAYVFVYATPGKVEGVAKKIAQIDGVRCAHMCWGRPDVIAFVQVATAKDLGQVVLRRIQGVEGVESTDTRILLEA